MENNSYILEQRKKIVKGLEAAYKKLIVFKRAINSPLVVMKDGKVILLDPQKAKATTTYHSK